MTSLDPLIVDFVEWVAREPRPYAAVMEAWRTSCPRLTVWEDAVDRGYVRRKPLPEGRTMVVATAAGLHYLRAHGCTLAAPVGEKARRGRGRPAEKGEAAPSRLRRKSA